MAGRFLFFIVLDEGRRIINRLTGFRDILSAPCWLRISCRVMLESRFSFVRLLHRILKRLLLGDILADGNKCVVDSGNVEGRCVPPNDPLVPVLPDGPG
jgi:hypothetical protein